MLSHFLNSRVVDVLSRQQDSFTKSFIRELQEHVNISLNRSAEYSIDRFVGDFAVLVPAESWDEVNIPISQMPEDAREGVTLRYENGIFTVNWERTNEINARIKDVWGRIRVRE